MADTPTVPEEAKPQKDKRKNVHEVVFVTYPKLLFVWPVILFGYVFFWFAPPLQPTADELVKLEQRAATGAVVEEMLPATTQPDEAAAPKPLDPYVSGWLEGLGWAYILTALLVFLTLGVDIGRNYAAFWVLLVVLIIVGGMWLSDTRGITILGDIYRGFDALDVQYNRSFALAMSIALTIPYAVMLFWARLNDRWRITHNEFEHYSFGRSDDSLGRGAKSIRTEFPDVFELLLGLAGTLIVYNATGSRELRRIPHVMFLPFVRSRLNKILERTAITTGIYDDEEDDEDV